MDLVIDAVTKKYANFSGRARRKEYWLYYLVYLIAYLILLAVDHGAGLVDPATKAGLLTSVFGLVLLIPSIAVTVRRLHDQDRSGWWILIILVPFIGAIVLLVFACIRGTDGDNRFGPDPLAAA